MNYSLIITPLVGAVIGYTTNWIAIKMLFRPYQAKKLMGIQLPFTPGLIPKERERIAKAIGQVVEDYLLTDQVILEELTSEQVKQGLQKTIEDELRQRNHAISLSLLIPNSSELEALARKATEIMVSSAIEVLNQNEFITQMANELINILSTKLDEKTLGKLFEEHNPTLEGIVNQIKNSAQIQKALENKLSVFMDSDKSLEEILTQPNVDIIEGLIEFNEPKIKDAIINLLEKEAFSSHVKLTIGEYVAGKFGALGSMFANPENIYHGIVDTSKEKLAQAEISGFIMEAIREVLQKQVLELIPEQSRISLISSVKKQIIEGFSQDLVKGLMNLEDTPLELGNELMEGKLNAQLNVAILKLLDGGILALEKNKEGAIQTLMPFVLKVLSTPITLEPSFEQKMITKLIASYEGVVQKHVIKIVQKTSLSRIVTSQINSFPVDMLENMILVIAKKELRAITWLGGLLGLIMSVIILLF